VLAALLATLLLFVLLVLLVLTAIFLATLLILSATLRSPPSPFLTTCSRSSSGFSGFRASSASRRLFGVM
jgi:Na+/serine symporter